MRSAPAPRRCVSHADSTAHRRTTVRIRSYRKREAKRAHTIQIKRFRTRVMRADRADTESYDEPIPRTSVFGRTLLTEEPPPAGRRLLGRPFGTSSPETQAARRTGLPTSLTSYPRGRDEASVRGRRSRTGPFAVEGSTTLPACVISTSPRATSRRAAARAGSIRSLQPSVPPTRRAASDGQIEAEAARSARSAKMADSSSRSRDVVLCLRHPSLQ